MITLFHSLFYRLKKDKLLFALAVACILFPIVFIIRNYFMEVSIDALFQIQMCFISIFFTLIVNSYIGVEYSDGTIRNKIIIGKKRYKIYLSNWLFLILLGLGMYLLYLLTIVCIGIPILGASSVDIQTIFLWIIVQVITIIAFISIFTFISFLCSNHVVAIIINMLISFGLIILIIFLATRLSTPEYIEVYQWNTITGQMEYMKVLNPQYPSPFEHSILLSSLYILPSSFSFAILFGIPMQIGITILVLIIVVILFTGLGIFFFSKKDLK